MKQQQNIRKIFVDLNVFVNSFTADYTKDYSSRICLQYIVGLKNCELYTSAQIVAVLFSMLQKSKNTKTYQRPPASKTEIEVYYKEICKNFNILDCTKRDIDTSLYLKNNDMEDNIQYTIGNAKGCFYYITEDSKFITMPRMVAIHPKNIFAIKNR